MASVIPKGGGGECHGKLIHDFGALRVDLGGKKLNDKKCYDPFKRHMFLAFFHHLFSQKGILTQL